MAATPTYAFRYPALSNAPNVPQDVQNLAEDVEAKIVTVDAAVAALQNPADIGLNVEQLTSGTTSSTSYTATLTGGTACGLAFTAPASGKVIILHNCRLSASTTAQLAYSTIRIRTGASIGSGTDVLAADDNYSVSTKDDFVEGKGRSKMQTGLTAGVSYNVQQLYRSSSGAATFLGKELIVLYIP